MRDMLARLFAHMAWADAQALESLQRSDTPADTVAVFAHLLAVEHVWLSRIRQVQPDYPVWPPLDLAQCAALAAKNAADFRAWLESQDDASLRAEVPYVNSAGQSFRSRVDDILLQVALHGCYHRGQVASGVRSSGGSPAATDYIGFVRGVPAARTPR